MQWPPPQKSTRETEEGPRVQRTSVGKGQDRTHHMRQWGKKKNILPRPTPWQCQLSAGRNYHPKSRCEESVMCPATSSFSWGGFQRSPLTLTPPLEANSGLRDCLAPRGKATWPVESQLVSVALLPEATTARVRATCTAQNRLQQPAPGGPKSWSCFHLLYMT